MSGEFLVQRCKDNRVNGECYSTKVRTTPTQKEAHRRKPDYHSQCCHFVRCPLQQSTSRLAPFQTWHRATPLPSQRLLSDSLSSTYRTPPGGRRIACQPNTSAVGVPLSQRAGARLRNCSGIGIIQPRIQVIPHSGSLQVRGPP